MEEKSLNEETYERLRHDIMTFELKPGDAISAQKVANRYDVSRTPAREAIVKLQKENLLNVRPQSGSYVAGINSERSRQEWFVRTSLEVGMVDRFFENVDEATIEKMEMLQQQLMNSKDNNGRLTRVEIDNAFHETVYDCCKENLAKTIIQTQMNHYNRIRFLAEINQSIEEKTNDEHLLLIEAAKKKDKEAYLDVIKKHLFRILDEEENLKQKYASYFD